MNPVQLLTSVIETIPKKIESVKWKPFSRLFIVKDSSNWVVSWETHEIAAICDKLQIHSVCKVSHRYFSRQCVFFSNRHFLLQDDWLKLRHRIATPYYHGKPGTGYAEFDRIYNKFCKYHVHIERIQVTNTEMRDIILASGINPDKVFLIPIGINLNYFSFRSINSQTEARRKWDIPETAFVVGSFQKDGNGWKDGNTPKLIKGPDIFIKALSLLKKSVPELLVLLSGPARGYVINELIKHGIQYRHIYLDNYPDIVSLYHVLDVYVISSRQEGGPKAILESMATGVPLVTTRVGQAIDLVEHEKNGWMVDVSDHEALAHWIEHVYRNINSLYLILKKGRRTAELNSYAAQVPLWSEFMYDFVMR